MNAIPITSTIAAFLAILMFPLTLQVSMRRIALVRAKGNPAASLIGDGDDEVLRRRVCAFGNFTEYVPICLVLLTLTELAGASTTLLWSIGGLLLTGRILHALGMAYVDSGALRGIATIMTYPAFLIPAGWLLMHVWG